MLITLESANVENTSPIKYFGVGEAGTFITNYSSQKLQRNFATGNFENTIVGSPTITNDSATLTSQSNYVQTGIAETALMSIFSIFKPVQANSFAAGNYTATGNQGVGLYVTSANLLSFFASHDNGSGSPTLNSATISTPVTLGNWLLVSGVAQSNGNVATNYTANLSQSQGTTTARMLQSNPLLIGSTWGGSYNGQSQHLITVIIPGVLTTAQTTSLIAALRAYATSHSITV